MIKCPNCGSSAQVKILTTQYMEDGWTIEVKRIYICGCGETFIGESYYHCQEAYEIIEPISRKKIQEQLYERG